MAMVYSVLFSRYFVHVNKTKIIESLLFTRSVCLQWFVTTLWFWQCRAPLQSTFSLYTWKEKVYVYKLLCKGFQWKWLVGSSVSHTRKSLYGNYYVRNHINPHQYWLVHTMCLSFLCVWRFNFRNFAIFPCSNFRIYPGKSLFEQFCISINVNVQVTCVLQLYTGNLFWWLNDR